MNDSLTGSMAIFTLVKKDDDDEQVISVRLHNGDSTVDLTNIGCAITAICTPDRQGNLKNIVSGFQKSTQYRVNREYMGAVVGRYANRIADGRFSLDGKQYQLSINNGKNHLHGGTTGFSHKIWQLLDASHNGQVCTAKFSYTSKDGEEGYPGNLTATVEYLLDDAGRLQIKYEATTDKSTPVNFTNHSYFNLTGFEDPSVLDHLLTLTADSYTEKNANNTPTGRILPVTGTELDFRRPKKIGEGINNFLSDKGYDHNFVLSSYNGQLTKAAILYEATTGRTLTVYTDKPGIQVYTANYWDSSVTGSHGVPYQQHGAVALETQSFPDSVNFPQFPGVILHPGEHYQSTTIYEWGIDQQG